MATAMIHDNLDDTFLPRKVSGSPHKNVSTSCLSEDDYQIQLAGFEPYSKVAGPGVRAVIWVAGCNRRCPGCSQPEFLPFQVGQKVSVRDLWDRINSLNNIAGLTFSGGEPFEQPEALAVLANRAHLKGLTVVSYSGYRLEALADNPKRFRSLLREVDLLIDGEYRAELAGRFKWRGSSNQRLICLTDKIKLSHEEAVSEMQISFNESQPEFALSGIWPPGVVQELILQLQERGFKMNHYDYQERIISKPRKPL